MILRYWQIRSTSSGFEAVERQQGKDGYLTNVSGETGRRVTGNTLEDVRVALSGAPYFAELAPPGKLSTPGVIEVWWA
jgi:hypothetical protein